MKKMKYRKVKRGKMFKYKGRSSNSKTVFKWIGFAGLTAVLVFVGYSVAGPFMNLINGLSSDPPASLPQLSSIDNRSSESGGNSSEPGSSSSNTIVQGQISGEVAYMPTDTMIDLAKADTFIKSAKDSGSTAIVVELKNSTGMIYYTSALPLVKEYGAQSESAISLPELLALFTKHDMIPIAKMHTFMDKTAPNAKRDNSFRYEGEGVSTWYDNSVANGGKPWLNPYKEKAVTYLLDIMNEIIDAGFTEVMLDSVQFPISTRYAGVNFEGQRDNQSFAQALDNFAKKAVEQAKAKKATVHYAFNASALAGVNTTAYGDDPLTRPFESFVPILDFKKFPSSATIGGVSVADTTNIPEVINAIFAPIIAKNPASITPMIVEPQTQEVVLNALGELELIPQSSLLTYIENVVG